MRLRTGAACLCLLLTAALALPALGAETVILDPAGDAPDVTILQSDARGLVLELTLPALQREDLEIAGESWQRLHIPGGALTGAEGRAALPVLSRTLNIPDQVAVRLRVLDADVVELPGLRLAPAEGVEGGETRVDRDWYAKAAAGAAPGAAVGDPAIMRDLRVVPVTFRPVAYDPAAGVVRAARRMTVALEYVDGPTVNPAPRRRAMIPESFDSFYAGSVLNYDGAAKSTPVSLGTYLVICPNNATVIAELEPLLDWRRRQGYNVLLAHTGQTGTTNTAIKNYIQNIYDTVEPALEFVTLVGDANGSVAIPAWTESLSGYGGGGDHYYTMLEGSDVLADVHLGRLSVTSTSELTLVVDKIVEYETSPDTGTDPGWFTRATLVGDPGTSGITTIFVNQWAKDQLLHHGYTQIDTVWSGSFANEMLTKFSNGGTLFTYRGWLGMSGLSPSYILNLTNQGELGFAVVMTCDTGSFASDTTCRSEAFLRAPNGGGVASIGTATIGTHTRYNNCMFTGVIDKTWNSDDHRVGPALTNGKLAMYNNYFVGEPARVEIWSVWNNLMGDPATEIWTAFPEEFVLDYPAVLVDGAASVRVAVSNRGTGLPVPGATVTLYKAGDIQVTGVTGADGTVNLAAAGLSAGDMDLTVRKHNYLPAQRVIAVGGVSEHVGLASYLVDDTDWGDSDGLLEAGEHVQLGVQVENFGTATAPGAVGVLTSADPYVTIQNGTVNYGDIAAGATAWGGAMFEITVAPDTPGLHRLQLDLAVTSGGETWYSLVEPAVKGPALAYVSDAYSGPGGDLDPGETGNLTIQVNNAGDLAANGLTGVLSTESPWVSILDADAYYGVANPGQSLDNLLDPFSVSIASDCYPGHLAVFALELSTSDGAAQTVTFTRTVGTAVSTDPVGPDAYGYYAFDDTDTGYPDAPVFDWVEIDPTLGGGGTSVGLNDTGWETDDTEYLALPFTFKMYGEEFDTISICSNGWLSMGVSQSRQYRSWSLPTAGAADGMVAAFWDNLFRSSVGGVFHWYDAANHRLVVEWSRMRAMWSSGSTGPEQTFQVILYDPAFHPTATGDGIIDVQYLTVNNGDTVNGYATAGLQNLDHTDGLLYEYWDVPAPAAAPLQAGRAIRYMPFVAVASGTLQGSATVGGAPVKDVTIEVLDANRSFVTAVSGAFSGNVPVGTWDVVASHPECLPDTAQVTIVEDQVTTLDFALTDVGGPRFLETTVLPGTSDTVGPYPVTSRIEDVSGLAEAHFWYMSSADGGPHELPLTLLDAPSGLYGADIPGQPEGSSVIYWLTGTDNAGNGSVHPAGAPVTAYSFLVRTEVQFVLDDMEAADGWVSGDAGDTAGTGLWERVDPNGVLEGGELVTPEDDHTADPGVNCWVTGQDPVGSAQGANDVDGGTTTLLSPTYDLTGYANVTASYWRWYTNETGNAPNSDTWTVQFRADGGAWQNVESTTASDRSWTRHSVQLGTLAAADPASVQFRFIADDSGAGSVVEAAVDDFALSGYAGAVDAVAPSVTVSSPNGGESYSVTPGVPVLESVTWSATDNVAVTHAVVLLSTDGGVSFPDTLAAGALDDLAQVVWPAVDSTTCRVKVVVFDAFLNAAEDVSDADFEIDASTAAGETPRSTILARNVPNPFNPATEISFAVPRAGHVTLKIFDLAGRTVRTLVDGRREAGSHAVMWRGEDDAGARAPSGTYFYRLEAGGEVFTRKMTLLK